MTELHGFSEVTAMREMKDSGIEWIGDIPANWEKCYLKYLCKFKTGGTPPNKIGIDSFDNGYPWITPQDITEKIYIDNYSQYISNEIVKSYGYQIFPPKSILLVCIASVGKVGFTNKSCYSNQQITALIPLDSNIVPVFLLYYIKSANKKISYDASSNIIPIINTTYLKKFYCVFPPLPEQQKIALP